MIADPDGGHNSTRFRRHRARTEAGSTIGLAQSGEALAGLEQITHGPSDRSDAGDAQGQTKGRRNICDGLLSACHYEDVGITGGANTA